MLGSVVFIAALFMAVSSFGLGDIVSRSLIAIAVGMLFIVAAALMSGVLRVEVLVSEEESGGRRELVKLASHYGINSTGSAAEVKRRIVSHLWRAKTGGRQVVPLEPPSAQILVEQLTTPRPNLSPDELKSFNRDTMQLLVKEGKSLVALARLLDVDKAYYSRMVGRAKRAMRNGDTERSIQAMQVANDKLRGALEEQVTREW